MKSVTIKDIAKVANVSYATVSRALSGSPEIGKETRERVLKICRDMGYTTNYVARSMVMKSTKLIGLVVANIDNPFMSEIAFHIETTAREHGYNLMLCNSAHDLDVEKQVFKLLVGRQVDGIIIVPTSVETCSVLRPYLDKVPTVFVSENLKDAAESYVAVDNFRGTCIGTEYLYGLGHRNILYFGRRKSSTTHQLRAEGYVASCEKFGIKPQFFNSSFTYSSIRHGYHMAKSLFQKPLECTAIFAATDSLALGIMEAADECGIRIPEDVSLMGFDNIKYAGLPKINLTTIEQPTPAMASVAVDVLLDKMKNATCGYSHRILLPTLVERKSCRRLESGERKA